MFILTWICLVAGLSKIDEKIAFFESTLQKFAAAREKLLNNVQIPDLTSNPQSLELEEWQMSKLIPRASFSFDKNIRNLQYLTLKPIGEFRDSVNTLNVALVIGYEDGTVEIVQNNGKILARTHVDFSPELMATTANYDEMKIALTAPGKPLVILRLDMDKPRAVAGIESPVLFNLTTETSVDIPTINPASMIHYVKTGKKFWVIGDKSGHINLYLLNGTLSKQSSNKGGPVTNLERFGQTLVFSSDSTVGVLNPNSLETSTICGDLGRIYDICIDTMSSSSIVYALVNDSLFALDTKYSMGNDVFCKGNSYKVMGSKKLTTGYSSIACARNYIAAWGKEEMILLNTSFYVAGSYGQTLRVASVEGQRKALESYRIQNLGALFTAFSEKALIVYEVVSPYKTAPPFDLGNVRFLVIVFAIGGAILWQYFRKGSDKGDKGKKYIPQRKRKFK